MNIIDQVFSEDTVRLIMMGVFAAFMLFYIIYGSFAAYHAIRFGYKNDLSIPTLLIFVAGSIFLGVITFGLLFV